MIRTENFIKKSEGKKEKESKESRSEGMVRKGDHHAIVRLTTAMGLSLVQGFYDVGISKSHS